MGLEEEGKIDRIGEETEDISLMEECSERSEKGGVEWEEGRKMGQETGGIHHP